MAFGVMCFFTGCMVGGASVLACSFFAQGHGKNGNMPPESPGMASPTYIDPHQQSTPDTSVDSSNVMKETQPKQTDGAHRVPGKTRPTCAHAMGPLVVPCPKWQHAMVMRADEGGGKFWGCPQYFQTPQCRGTRTRNEVRQMDVCPSSSSPHHEQ